MDSYLELSRDDRRLMCEDARATLGLTAESIEKDFWVCWTLRQLFTLAEWGPSLTFNVGTSLSMGWKLIERFSEDIDVVIDREFLGFGGARLSNKQIGRLKDESSRRRSIEDREALRSGVQRRMSQFPFLIDEWAAVHGFGRDL